MHGQPLQDFMLKITKIKSKQDKVSNQRVKGRGIIESNVCSLLYSRNTNLLILCGYFTSIVPYSIRKLMRLAKKAAATTTTITYNNKQTHNQPRKACTVRLRGLPPAAPSVR